MGRVRLWADRRRGSGSNFSGNGFGFQRKIAPKTFRNVAARMGGFLFGGSRHESIIGYNKGCVTLNSPRVFQRGQPFSVSDTRRLYWSGATSGNMGTSTLVSHPKLDASYLSSVCYRALFLLRCRSDNKLSPFLNTSFSWSWAAAFWYLGGIAPDCLS